jgi:hypothetical protein
MIFLYNKSQEQLKEVDEEDEGEKSSKGSRKMDSVDDSVDECDNKNFGNGVIEIKLEQRKPEELKPEVEPPAQRRVSNLLYADDTAARRMLLHREDAVSVSSPSSDDSIKSPQTSCDKLAEKRKSTQDTIVEIKPKVGETKRSQSKKISKDGKHILNY